MIDNTTEVKKTVENRLQLRAANNFIVFQDVFQTREKASIVFWFISWNEMSWFAGSPLNAEWQSDASEKLTISISQQESHELEIGGKQPY